MPVLHNSLRSRRETAAYSQLALANELGISRQALIAIEAGRQVPSTALALAIARILGCAVEDIFTLEAPSLEKVEYIPALTQRYSTRRVILARIHDRTVAHPLSDYTDVADAIIVNNPPADQSPTLVAVEQLGAGFKKNLIIAGCAPLMQVLLRRMQMAYQGERAFALNRNNSESLRLLTEGHVHIAGVHDGGIKIRGRWNAVRLLTWRIGIAYTARNPHGITSSKDLAERKLRFAWREEGSGAHRLLVAALSTQRIPALRVAVFDHESVARFIAYGIADVGITIESAAKEYGLGFTPLAEECFELIIPEVFENLPSVGRLIDTISNRTFQREAEALGYSMAGAGTNRRL